MPLQPHNYTRQVNTDLIAPCFPSLIQIHSHHAGPSEGTAGHNVQKQKPCNYRPAGTAPSLLRGCLGGARKARSGSRGGRPGGSCSADRAWTSWAGWRATRGLSPGDCCGDAAAAAPSDCLQVTTSTDSPAGLLIGLQPALPTHTLLPSCTGSPLASRACKKGNEGTIALPIFYGIQNLAPWPALQQAA